MACSDLDPARASALARQYDLKDMTYEEILQDPEISMVINLTIPAAHYPVTKQALDNGREKAFSLPQFNYWIFYSSYCHLSTVNPQIIAAFI